MSTHEVKAHEVIICVWRNTSMQMCLYVCLCRYTFSSEDMILLGIPPVPLVHGGRQSGGFNLKAGFNNQPIQSKGLLAIISQDTSQLCRYRNKLRRFALSLYKCKNLVCSAEPQGHLLSFLECYPISESIPSSCRAFASFRTSPNSPHFLAPCPRHKS